MSNDRYVSEWTDVRVELLKKLWADGLSAGQIAKQLTGVSRNSVIGKIHRLGLSGRASPSKPARIAKAPRTSVALNNKVRPGGSPFGFTPAGEQSRRSGLMPAQPPRAPMPKDRPGDTALCHDLLDLKSHMCRWPIGDPVEAGFGFCGRKTDGTYCEAHQARSVDRTSTLAGRSAADLARSLRRYTG